ncbi:glutamate synthase [Amylibacter ulvae]|uniref:Glutamate synthase n=1 Tax=Paramylibacter ulvae TaxID=1651968 RepID=A0ABQ3D173_9RHOB|nr:NAD(P)/FAD-dependent oxidoreductase [Amylibacter ulvae]GHA51694.1 glutamate synthase [Amylibacter ulvae]
MKIAIVGCGIGGLASAIMLQEQGHELTVFDQFETSAPVGSGLVIQPVGQRVLSSLGVLHHAIDAGAKIFHMLGHETKRNRAVLNVAYGAKGGADFGLAIHRAALFDILWKRANAIGVAIANGHKAIHSTASDIGRMVTFEHGTTVGPFDLVIDAAGANSPLSPLVARDLSYGAIWGTVDWPNGTSLAQDELRQKYHRAKNMIGILPLGTMPNDNTPKAALFWSLPRNGYNTWKQNLLSQWQNDAIALWPEIEPFVSQIKSHDDMTMAKYSHGTLRRPYSDRLVHVGDATHRASPQLGQGANMALLDAYAMAESLRTKPSNALENYARARKWHAGIYQAMSWAFTPMYQSDSRLLPILRDYLLAPASVVPPVPQILTKLVCGSLVNPARGVAPLD